MRGVPQFEELFLFAVPIRTMGESGQTMLGIYFKREQRNKKNRRQIVRILEQAGVVVGHILYNDDVEVWHTDTPYVSDKFCYPEEFI
jgi:hypothetical protein